MSISSIKLWAALALAAGAAAVQASEAVAPGVRICRGPIYVNTTVTAFGQSGNAYGHPAVAHFTVKRANTYDGEYDEVFIQDAASFYFSASSASRPNIVPGWIKACARNNGTSTIYVDLQLSGY